MLQDRHEVRYSPTHISHSIFILSLGYTEKRSKEWKQGIVRTIGITCESLRFYWMRDLIKRTSDLNAYVVETPSTEVIKIMNSWDKISRSVRSGNPFKLGTTTHPHHTLCKIVSLLNRNDGTEMENLENSLNKCVPLNCNDCTDMEDSENPLKKSVLLNCNDGTEMVNSQKILVPSKENIGQCFLVPHHRICPIRANDDNFLSRVPSSISDRSGIPLQLITNTYSHGISSMVLSQLTRNDGFEMDNPLNGKGSLLPQRSICPRGAIAGTKEPQHSIFPRRASDCLSQVLSCISYGSGKPSKLIANAYSHTISSSLLPHHSICPRGAIVGTKEPQCSVFPRKAYGCNFLSQVLSCISYGSAKPSKLITNTYSHGISSTVFSPLTRNDDTEMGNSWNGKGKVGCLNEPSSLVPQRDICPRGAIADSLVPQHIICPRRSNAVVHYSPPLPPARAYRCPKPLYSNCLISASRMMLFFMRRR